MGANIFQTYLQPPRSVIDYQNDYAKADQLRNQNALQALAIQQGGLTLQQQQASTQQSLAERNALQRLAAGWSADTTPEQRIMSLRNSGLPGLMQQADALETQNLSRIKTGADAAQATAHAGLFKTEADQKAYDLRVQKANKAIADISALGTPQEALASLQQHRQAGDIDEQKFQAVAATIPPDQAQFPQWRKQMLLNILDAKTQLEMTKPVIKERDNGGTSNVLAIDPMSGEVRVTDTTKKTPSPDAQLQANVSRQNNTATIAKDYAVAGLNPDGSPSSDIEQMAKMISSGQVPPLSGFALANPRGQRIMARVSEINPQYDYTDVEAKKKAAKDFTTGALGNSMRSFAVAGQHLDQLGELVDAMNNGNKPLINKLANLYSQNTGSPAVTNFDAAKDVVSKEVIKAIVAGGGGVSERQELSNLMNNANSPAQLKGVIQQYRNLMAAQHDALLQQRRAAGLKDSTLPSYTDANGSAAPPKTVNFGDLK